MTVIESGFGITVLFSTAVFPLLVSVTFSSSTVVEFERFHVLRKSLNSLDFDILSLIITTTFYNNNNNNTIFLQSSSVSYNKAAIKRSPVLNKIVFALP